MRRYGALFLELWIVWLVGCVSGGPARPTAWLDRLRPFHSPANPDWISVDVALLECPVGDSFINQGLWEEADEEIVPLDRSAVLEDNGFRVGQVGEVLPTRLQALLNSERSRAVTRRERIRNGSQFTVSLGPDMAHCHFDLHQDGRVVAVDLDDAQCCFRITVNKTGDRSTELQILPQVQYGQRRTVLRPTAEHDTVQVDDHRPTREFTNIGWKVTLAPKQFLVIGTRYERPNTLGQHCFYRPDEARPVQRLLMLWPAQQADPENAVTAYMSRSASRVNAMVPPIAEQAAWTTARGQAP